MLEQLSLVYVLILTTLATNPGIDFSGSKPNILVIIADDLGYGDLVSYGNPSQEFTPIDLLAKNGLRFTQFYSADSLCSPSRAALMTGRLPVRVGVYGDMRVFVPLDSGGLPKDELTMPEMLKRANYQTGMVGKWHLGINEFHEGDGSHLPGNHGFDFVGVNLPMSNVIECDESKQFEPNGPVPTVCFLYNGSKIIQQPYSHVGLTDKLVFDFKRFVDTRDPNLPFFFYFSFPQVHTDLFSWMTGFKSKRGLFGGDLNEMGDAVGNIVDYLKTNKLEKETLIIFKSDHGPHTELCTFGGETGGLKGGKGNSFEGGFRIPAIAYWPGVITGGTSTAILKSLDLFPTFANLAGVKLNFDSLKLDGEDRTWDLLGLTGSDSVEVENRDRIVYYYCSSTLMAVRYGNFKVHYFTMTVFGSRSEGAKEHYCPGGIPIYSWYEMDSQCPSEASIPLNPPLLFNLGSDPQERFPLNISLVGNLELLNKIDEIVFWHKRNIRPGKQLLGNYKTKLIPCCDPPKCTCNYNGTTATKLYLSELYNKDEL